MRILVCSDGHSGHMEGLTPPKWQINDEQRYWYRNFIEIIDSLKPINYLFLMGDMMDGTGKYHKGTDSLTTSIPEQLEMNVDWIEAVEPENIVLVAGTDSHTGDGQDCEQILTNQLRHSGKYNEVIYDEMADVVIMDRYIFNLRHFCSGSIVPYGKHTPGAREGIKDSLDKFVLNRKFFDDWYGKGIEYIYVLRGHTHHCTESLCFNPPYYAITCPSLQAGSKYGRKKFNHSADWGVIYFDLDGNGNGFYPRPNPIIKPLTFKRGIYKI